MDDLNHAFSAEFQDFKRYLIDRNLLSQREVMEYFTDVRRRKAEAICRKKHERGEVVEVGHVYEMCGVADYASFAPPEFSVPRKMKVRAAPQKKRRPKGSKRSSAARRALEERQALLDKIAEAQAALLGAPPAQVARIASRLQIWQRELSAL